MVILDIYKDHAGISSLEELEIFFQETLLTTNRTPAFFVDWSKVQRNVEELNDDISSLSLILKDSNLEQRLKELILRNPKLARILPRLVAIRNLQFPVIFNSSSNVIDSTWIDFDRTSKIIPEYHEIDDLMRFAADSCMIQTLKDIENIHDYLLGIEVGMDTHARKNRSGKAMETLIKPEIKRICDILGCEMLVQKPFKRVADRMSIPKNLQNRRADFIIHSDSCFVNIEVNFYSAGGSKPEEIVDSYINRHQELSEAKWRFIWITDGNRWSTCSSQLQKAIRELECVLNIRLVKMGVLEDALRLFLEIQ